jgi:molybdate-binding protein/DNA-binding XRE family transcriptional regulator
MDVHSNLAQLRAKRGLGASQLAAAVGISRQTVYAIEAGTYVPNTAVSLKLARILDSTVEEIFSLELEQPAAETAEVFALGDPGIMQAGQPLQLCKIGGRIVAVSAEAGAWGLAPADAVLIAPIRGKRNTNAKVRILGADWASASRILIAGCDPSASILASSLQRQDCELVIAFENSSRSLELLREGLVHVAGTHLEEKTDAKNALSPIIKMFPRNSVAIISYAIWQEGLVIARGNPKKINGVADLARRDVRIVNREQGAACRILLDEFLHEHHMAASSVKGYEREVTGQLPAARLVQSGEVDCCVSTQASAAPLGLDFIPLAQKPYRLVLRRKDLDLAPIQSLVKTLGSASFRREVEACVGYEMRSSGDRLA